MRGICKKFLLFFIVLIAAHVSLCAQHLDSATTEIPLTEKVTDTTNPDTTVVPATAVPSDALAGIYSVHYPQQYTVADISITGSKFFDKALLLSMANLNVGDVITIPGGDNFSKAINKLWGQNYFSNVEIFITKVEGKKISIELHVIERPRLTKFFFRGVPKGDDEELATKSRLVAGHVVTENMTRTAESGIKSFYAGKGFQNTTVTLETEIDSAKNSVILYFYIDKGGKVRIGDIFFDGNDNVSSATLRRKMEGTHQQMRITLFPPNNVGRGFINHTPYTFKQYLLDKGFLTYTLTNKFVNPYLRFAFSNAKFATEKYVDDQQKLLEFYNTLGYRDATIVRDTVFHNSQKNIGIDIKITEGARYYFGTIIWRGNTKYPDSLLTAILNIHKGDLFNQKLLNQKLGIGAGPDGGDISSIYQDDGYLFFHSEAVETAVYNDTIDFQINISEGPQAIIKNVRIHGNEKTKDYVIRRELRTLPGNKFSRSEIVRSVRELATLGFFNQEKIEPKPIPDPENGTVDIDWYLEEKSADQLELSAGWGGNIGLTGTIGVSFNNFSVQNIFNKRAWDPLPTGDGQKLSVRFQSNGSAFRSFNVSLTQPWVGGKQRNSLTYSFYDTKYSNSYNAVTGQYTNSASSSYIHTTGYGISFGKSLTWPDDYFTGSIGLNYVRYDLNNYYIDQVNLPSFNNGYSNNFSLRLTLQRSSINQPMYPTSGSSLMVYAQITPPYSLINPALVTTSNPYTWIEYHKWRFTGDWYVSLSNRTNAQRQPVFRFSVKYGFLGRYNNLLSISPFERFQLGGGGLSNSYALLGYDIVSLRGYPVFQSSDPTVNPQQTSASQFFTIFNKYTMELRYPISLSPSSTIYALTFFEAGNGWYNIQTYNPFQLRRSIGIGARFFLPAFGLLGFDYGIGLDRIVPGQGFSGAAQFTFMLGREPD